MAMRNSFLLVLWFLRPGFLLSGLLWVLWPEGRRAYQRLMRGER